MAVTSYDLKDLIIQSDKAYSAADLYDDIPLCAMAVGNGEIDCPDQARSEASASFLQPYRQ